MPNPSTPPDAGDPARLRELLERSVKLSAEHAVPSVVVGLAGREGDLLVPELVDYLTSALRVEDAIVRMTRERAVLFLADVDAAQAHAVVERLVDDYAAQFAPREAPAVRFKYYEVPPGSDPLRLKDVLPAVFPA